MGRISEANAEQMILYEDRDILVCHKEAGIPVQSAGIGTKDMESMLLNYLTERQQQEQAFRPGKSGEAGSFAGKAPYLGIVHRLDQPVEGIVVFAKNKKAASGLSRQIAGGIMNKIYYAVCCVDKDSLGSGKIPSGTAVFKEGNSSGEDGAEQEYRLVSYLKKDARANISSVAGKGAPGAKRAELKYRVQKRYEYQGKAYELVRITLLTGRHHQIRVQMADAGLALYGDRKYNREWEAFCVPESGAGSGTRLALCAAELTFLHPVSGKRIHFEVTPFFCQQNCFLTLTHES